MAPVDVTVTLRADQQQVFDLLLDMDRTPDWVTICKEVLHTDQGDPKPGWQCKQRYVLRGAPFTVTWTLDELEPSSHIAWKGKGPAGSTASIRQDVEDIGDGKVRLRYFNEFKAPGGFVGKIASRALMGGVPDSEARKSLDQLQDLIDGE